MPFVIVDASAGLTASGMVKSGTATTSGSWTQLRSWTADTTNYPGSTVSSDALVCQGAKDAATISASVAWTSSYPNSIQVRIRQNGALATTGTTSTTSPSTATITVPVANGDTLTVEIIDNSSYASLGPATVTAGSSTYLRVS